MIPKNNPDEFVRRYGNLWYLREFDYFPEPLEHYHLPINALMMKNKHCFDFFDSLEEAWKASYEIRELRGLRKYIR